LVHPRWCTGFSRLLMYRLQPGLIGNTRSTPNAAA
jgi:hypothetical protein